MAIRRALYILVFLTLALPATAQINIYVGGNLQGNLSWIRGNDKAVMKPGLGGGFSFVYWEYEYWFIKAGLDYSYMASMSQEYPDDYGITDFGPDDLVDVDITEHAVGVPLVLYFRPYEKGANSMLITASLETKMITRVKGSNDDFGDIIYKWGDIRSRTKTNIGIGVGYQRQLDRHMFMNIYPSYNIDIRARRPFSSINLTAELIFGVY